MSRRPPRIIDGPLLAGRPLPDHGAGASKADRGKLLIVAGSAGLPGAAILAGLSALHVGCGTVRVAAPRSVALAIGVAVPELMVIPLPETISGTAAESAFSPLEGQFGPCDAAVIGPGMGSDEETDRLATRLVAALPLPTVVDGGALVAWGRAGHPAGPGTRVLTPHDGELAAMTALSVNAIGRDREAFAARVAEDWDSTLVMKGPRTLIAGDGLFRNTAGTPGLATAGSGDVLAGTIGGLLARGADPTTAAIWGVHIHARAGEIAAERWGVDGLKASDVSGCLREALRALRPPG